MTKKLGVRYSTITIELSDAPAPRGWRHFVSPFEEQGRDNEVGRHWDPFTFRRFKSILLENGKVEQADSERVEAPEDGDGTNEIGEDHEIAAIGMRVSLIFLAGSEVVTVTDDEDDQNGLSIVINMCPKLMVMIMMATSQLSRDIL